MFDKEWGTWVYRRVLKMFPCYTKIQRIQYFARSPLERMHERDYFGNIDCQISYFSRYPYEAEVRHGNVVILIVRPGIFGLKLNGFLLLLYRFVPIRRLPYRYDTILTTISAISWYRYTVWPLLLIVWGTMHKLTSICMFIKPVIHY